MIIPHKFYKHCYLIASNIHSLKYGDFHIGVPPSLLKEVIVEELQKYNATAIISPSVPLNDSDAFTISEIIFNTPEGETLFSLRWQ